MLALVVVAAIGEEPIVPITSCQNVPSVVVEDTSVRVGLIRILGNQEVIDAWVSSQQVPAVLWTFAR